MPEIAQIRANVLNNFSACQLSQCTLARFVNSFIGNKSQMFFICMCVCLLCCFSGFQLFVTLRIRIRQAPLSIGFSRQEYWSGLPFPSPGNLQDPRIELASPVSPALQVDSLPAEPSRKPNPLFLQTEPKKNRKKGKMPSYCFETTWIFLGCRFSRRHLLKNHFEKRLLGGRG